MQLFPVFETNRRHDFSLQPRCKWGLCSFGMLRRADC